MMAANYITPDSAGTQQWSSLQALRNGSWYSGGASITPTQNDYAIFINTDNSTFESKAIVDDNRVKILMLKIG